jgi:hypothetical protein
VQLRSIWSVKEQLWGTVFNLRSPRQCNSSLRRLFNDGPQGTVRDVEGLALRPAPLLSGRAPAHFAMVLLFFGAAVILQNFPTAKERQRPGTYSSGASTMPRKRLKNAARPSARLLSAASSLRPRTFRVSRPNRPCLTKQLSTVQSPTLARFGD